MTNLINNAYQTVLAGCSPLQWESPWSFVPATNDCRGPVSDPETLLRTLLADHPVSILEQTGIVEKTPTGVRLTAALTEADSVVVALRGTPDGLPFDLLTSTGCLSRRQLSALAALGDATTKAAIDKEEMLIVASSIREVALLRSLGLPGTLSTGLACLKSVDAIRALHAVFGEESNAELSAAADAELLAEETLGQVDSVGPEHADHSIGEELAKHQSDGESVTPQPSLIVMNWQLLSLCGDVSTAFPAIAARFEKIEMGMDLQFAVSVWRPSPASFEKIRICVELSDMDLVRAALLEGIHLNDLQWIGNPKNCADPSMEAVPFDALHAAGAGTEADLKAGGELRTGQVPASGPPAPSAYVRAHDDLIRSLTGGDDRDEMSRPRGGNALKNYDSVVRRDLVQPLQDWALAQGDPLIRATGIQLANVCLLLHTLTPIVLALDDSPSARAARVCDPQRLKVMAEYTALFSLCSHLVTALDKLRNWR